MRFLSLFTSAAALLAYNAEARPFFSEAGTQGSPQPRVLKNAFNYKRGLPSTLSSKHLRPVLEPRAEPEQIISSNGPEVSVPGYSSDEFAKGQPINSKTGKGAPLLGEFPLVWDPHCALLTVPTGGTNNIIDVQNPSNLGQEPTDHGVVVNLKWRFSDSKTNLYKGGWARGQVITDLPASQDISAAQQHLKKGAFRELHWHKVVSTANSPAKCWFADWASLNGPLYMLDGLPYRP